MIPTHQAAWYMERATIVACAVAVAGIIGYRSLLRQARRLLHWLACAWMQCDREPCT